MSVGILGGTRAYCGESDVATKTADVDNVVIANVQNYDAALRDPSKFTRDIDITAIAGRVIPGNLHYREPSVIIRMDCMSDGGAAFKRKEHVVRRVSARLTVPEAMDLCREIIRLCGESQNGVKP